MTETSPIIYFPPTIQKEIDTINTWLLTQEFCALPQDYQSFLLQSNGMSYNGLDLYGSCTHYREIKNYTYPSLQTINQNFINYSFFKNKVIIGNWNESLIYYDPKGNYYALADRINLRSRQEFEDFEKLLTYLLSLIKI